MKRILFTLLTWITPTKTGRNKLRFIAQNPIGYCRKCLQFVRDHEGKRVKISTAIGFKPRNILIIAGNRTVYKFPAIHRIGQAENISREKKIMDAFRPISPISIPLMEIIKWGKVTVVKMDYVRGKTINEFSLITLRKHRIKIAQQLAKFIYEIGLSDPKQLRDLKREENGKPGFMYGWCHADFGGNFIIDPHTMEIAAMIDWEKTKFGNFETPFLSAASFYKDPKLGAALVTEYAKLWIKK